MNLATRVLGVDFQNPVLLAAGTCGFGAELEEVLDRELDNSYSMATLSTVPRLLIETIFVISLFVLSSRFINRVIFFSFSNKIFSCLFFNSSFEHFASITIRLIIFIRRSFSSTMSFIFALSSFSLFLLLFSSSRSFSSSFLVFSGTLSVVVLFVVVVVFFFFV